MTELDIFNQLHYAKEDGFAEGLAEGEAKGRTEGLAEGEKLAKIETAKNLKKKDIPIDIICRVTGLPAEEIAKL